jgi:hypothetical protein
MVRLARFFLCTLVCSVGIIQGAFEENRGQADATVQFLAKTTQGQVFFTRDSFIVDGPGGAAVTFRFEGTQGTPAWTPAEPTGAKTSYFIGRDRSKWVSNAPSYNNMLRRGLYPGIDASFYTTAASLEYDLVLAPHADPRNIRIRVSGARTLSIDPHGDLVAKTARGEVRQRKPVIYQMEQGGSKRAVEGRFRLIARNLVGIELGVYDAP